MSFKKYVAKRLALMLLVMLGVSVVTFAIARVMPSNPAQAWAGPRAKEEQVKEAREFLGLDEPLYIQYLLYMKGLLHGDLGKSIATKRPVSEDIKIFFPVTLELTTISLFMAVLIGIPLGIVCSLKKNSVIDHFLRFVSISGVSIPIFWLGIMLQILFFRELNILPLESVMSFEVHFASPLERITGMYIVDSLLTGNWAVLKEVLVHMILPVTCLSYASLATIMRMTRSSMLETLNKDYIKTEKAYGLPQRIVIFKHGLKNALVPVTSVAGLTFGYLLGGSVLIESVFNWPGIGRYTVNAIMRVDYPAIMGVTLVYALSYIFINFIVDILHAFIDPRISY